MSVRNKSLFLVMILVMISCMVSCTTERAEPGKATSTPATATPFINTPTPTAEISPTPLVTPEPEPTPPDYENIAKEALPRVDIVTDNGQDITSKEYYVNAQISLSGCDEKYVFDNSRAEVKVRGNSTAAAPKKPYRIKFEKKQTFLGLNEDAECRSWCLMADYYDGTNLRTWATFNFAKVLMENKYYSSDCTHVEVYVNGRYAGVYLLCEHTQINKNRIDIPDNDEGNTDVEIGYLLIGQGGRFDEPESIVVSPGIDVKDRNGEVRRFTNMHFALSGNGYTEAQKEYVSRYASAVFKVVAAALYENTFYDLAKDGTMTIKKDFKGKTIEEKQIETIEAVFNIDSAVRMCVLDEIAKNLDAMTFNMYVDLSPSGDGRLTLAAPWDFDFSMGNTHYQSTHSTYGFYATNFSVSEGMRTNLWFVMLGSIGWFEEKCMELWQKHYNDIVSVCYQTLTLSYKYQDAFQRDYDLWGLPVTRNLIHHHCVEDLSKINKHLDAGEFLSSWLIQRCRWLNLMWGNNVERPTLEDIVFDFTKEENSIYVQDFKRCEGVITENGLRVTINEAYDPYFTLNIGGIGMLYSEDYPYLEIEYMLPSMNSDVCINGELFLCTGEVTHATAGISTSIRWGDKRDQFDVLKVDLGSTGHWHGAIFSIRVDFFNGCEIYDEITIKSVTLKQTP